MQMLFDEVYVQIGKNIKKLRKNAGLTQEALAEKAEISLDHMGKIEVNINQPGLKTLIKLSKILNVSLQEFFARL